MVSFFINVSPHLMFESLSSAIHNHVHLSTFGVGSMTCRTLTGICKRKGKELAPIQDDRSKGGGEKPLTVRSDKSSVNLTEPLTTVLQRLCNVVTLVKPRVLVQEQINLDPNAVTGVVGGDALEAVNDGAESVAQVHDLLLQIGVGGLAGEARHVFETGACPVVDDEEGEQAGAYGVEPPGGGFEAYEGEEKREGVEVDVCFAV